MALLEPGDAANAYKENILRYQAGQTSLLFRRPHQRNWLL
jgi:hypothetical protein